MKTKLLAMMLLAGGSMFAQTRFSVGVGFNAPPVYVSNMPPCPGPGYVWLNGYWHAPVVRAGFGFAPRFNDHFRGVDIRERGRAFNGHDHGSGFRGR
jgi:hypothetical protein